MSRESKQSTVTDGRNHDDVVGPKRIDPSVVSELYVRCAEELRCFILGVVRDPELTAEVVQTAFGKVLERGHEVKEESLRAWVFRVAYNEALAVRRRQAVGDRVTRHLAEGRSVADREKSSGRETATPEANASREETVALVRQALRQLPREQQEVVRKRIYEGKRFAEIAEELQLPLGTVLSRMQLALKKLRRRLDGNEMS